MGKLNYTNRRISGVKLGTSIKKDLLKRAPEASGKNAAKDCHLELIISGKALGDEGLAIVCEALCQTIEKGAMKLDELHLSDNKITLNGLKSLASVIKATSNDLKDLDLSGNAISVISEEDVRIWEEFLDSFHEVGNLRRLNLSGNPFGVGRGFETLLRCYSRESPLYLPKIFELKVEEIPGEETDFLDDSSTETDPDDEDLVNGHKIRALSLRRELSASPPTVYSVASTPAKPGKSFYASGQSQQPATGFILQGLRSIPYIILSDTGMTDASALHLSYLLSNHPLPQHLLPFFPVVKTGSQIETYDAHDTESGCAGVIYFPNPKLTSLGIKVLEAAEGNRAGDCSTGFRSALSRKRRTSEGSTGTGSPTRTKSGLFSPSTSVVGSLNELDRSRSKIQGAILREDGPVKVDLWTAALRTLILTRALLLDEESPSLNGGSNGVGQQNGYFSPSASLPNPAVPVSPNSSGGLSAHSYKAYRLALCSNIPSPVAARSGRFLPGKLPENLWEKIISLAADPNGTMSMQQLRGVIEWGRQRETLMREKEFSGKLPSVQIWRFLEGLDCLTYEV